MAFSMENRPLKKLKLGPPDVYPQDPKQKEDELTPVNVKQGFSHTPNLNQAEEYGSAKNHNFSLAKVQNFINGVLAKKQEINTLPDTGRKRQIINPKENFHNVTPKSKAFIESWFKDLAGSKPLANLGKRVPIFNKKEEIFMQLSEYQVPTLRAIWLLKMTSAYSVAISEAKMKKRQVPDSSQEWTSTLVRFIKEQLVKLQDFYQKSGNSGNIGALVSNAANYHNGNPAMTDEQKLALRQFNYCQPLCKVMFEEGLLECQDFLQWQLDMLEKCKSCDDSLLKLIVPFILQYIDEFTQCEILSRRLVFQVCKRITPLLPTDPTSETSPILDVGNCTQHRTVLVQMSAIIQAVVLHCPTAVIWNHVGEGKMSSHLIGSPLDHLPHPPSSLPMAPRFSNNHVRQLLREAETRIRQRSKAAEVRWSLDKLSPPSSSNPSSPNKNCPAGGIITTLQVLEALDRHCFDRVDSSNNIDTLHSKIFQSVGCNKNTSEPTTVEAVMQLAKKDEPLVRLLCQWAVSDQRYGEHRALATAQLLDKRQSDLVGLVENEISGNNDNNDSEEPPATAGGSTTILQPVYQGFLMKFLDSEAPTLHDSASGHNSRAVFASLVHLFYELIKHDVFSHDLYLRTLISRGDLLSVGPNSNGTSNTSTSHVHLAGPPSGGINTMSGFQSMNSEMDDSKIDDDLGKLLQHIKEEQQIVMDAPDSPKDESSHGGLESASSRVDKECKRQSRHLLFTTHFPLPQDDQTMVHDCNQRHILLYGVGKAREESRHAVKKISKEVCRLFHKKLAIDVQAEGTSIMLGGGSGSFSGGSSKPRKHSSRLDFNFELSMQRFLGLSYFDRHAVCTQAASACLEMISSFTGGGTAYLPVLEHISFLFDLFEVSLSISGLIELCLQLLKELPEVELLLSQRNSVLSRSYLTNVGLYVVGVLRRFHCCLLLSPESTAVAFESLCRIVKHVTNPADCSSAERCILAYLYDLYSCCSFLKVKNHQLDSSLIGTGVRDSGSRGSAGGGEVFAFSNAYPKIKQTIFAPVQPSAAVHPQNREFLQEFISNPRRKPEGHVLRQLSDSAQLRYSFVCNVVVAVCNETDNDRLNDIALLCAELTAGCSALSAEWLGVLTALCYSASTYIDVLTQVDVQDNAIHHNLAILFSVLLARHCFGLQDFLLYVGVPSLVKIWNEGGRSDVDPEAEAGARLTCHLVLRLFKTSDAPHPACYSSSSHSVNVSPHVNTLQQSPSPSLGVKLACDRHLLAATHNSISVGPVLAVLKAILVLADRIPAEGKGGRSAGNNSNSSGSSRGGGGISMTNEVSISHILGTSWSGDLDLEMGSNNFGMGGGGRNNLGGNAENVALATYARCVLKQICSQPWVHQRCLQNPEELLKPDGLLDSCLSFRQAQRLLQMISRPDLSAIAAEEITNIQQDSRKVVNRVLDSLDQWRLRVAWLDLQLLCQQLAPSSSGVSTTAEMNQLLDAIARAVLDVFELSQPMGIKEEGDSSNGSNALKKRTEASGGSTVTGCSGKSFLASSVSLIAPLVSKLPGSVQGRILKVASQVLETCNWSPPTKTKKEDKERNVSGNISIPSASVRPRSLLSYEPLLSLVMTCLKGQDEQREAFLSSLYSQLSHFIFLSKEDRLFQGEDMKARQAMLEALQLRFSLVGGLYDSLLKNPTAAIDWAVLFSQLVTTGVIDLSNNMELFDTLQDMLATLLHSTLVLDGQSDRGDDGRKYYPVLIKKLKKELAERKSSPSIQCIKKLLPLPKLANEFVTCEPYGTLTDTKGNKISDFDSNDKKQGHRLHEKQRVSPWEILEGQKTAAPLSWAWFGAVRIERKPLRHQEVQRLLRHHTHSLQKPASYYLEHPILPPEEIEPPVIIEKVMMTHQPKEEISSLFKMEIPASDQSPRGGNKRGQKTSQRRPRGRRGAANAAAAAAAAAAATGMGQPQTSMGGYHSPAASGMYPPPPQGPHQWNSYQGPQSTPASSQQQQPGTVPTPSAPFFPPHQIGQGVGGPRFPAERPGSQSRQAISNMLRQRHPGAQQHPGNQFIPGPSQTPATVPGGVSGPGLAAGGAPASTGAHQNMIGNARGPVGPGGAGGGAVGVVAGQQPPFSNLSIVDKQRQQQNFMRQRQQQTSGGNPVFGQPGGPQPVPQTGQQPQLQPPQQQQPQLSMGQGGFPNMHGRQQSFNNFQGGAQPGVMQQQGQGQPQAAQQQQQQGMMGQHFNQGTGGNFPIQQQVQVQQAQHQGRAGAVPVRAPFMQTTTAGMPVGGGQPNPPFPVVRGASMPPNPNQQQQQVRLQHQQMVTMQQMQHGMGQQPQQTPQQHYHQQF